MFALHPRLTADTHFLIDWPLSRVLLMNDARYSWLILVPREERLREIHELAAPQRQQLIEEIAAASRVLDSLTQCDKINVGALGNLVPQLHIHVIARKTGDTAWPGPVWGNGAAEPYDIQLADKLVEQLQVRLTREFSPRT